jgi:hypothetical protein
LVIAALGFDLGVLAAAQDWPLEVTTPATLALLWVAWIVSLCAFFALHARGRGDDWRGGGTEPDPDPPWWPEVERWLRDSGRDRPRVPAG